MCRLGNINYVCWEVAMNTLDMYSLIGLVVMLGGVSRARTAWTGAQVCSRVDSS